MKHSLKKRSKIVTRATGLSSEDGSQPKVNLFLIGAQKAGTTALHSMLSELPEIQMSAKKEIHFFDRDKWDWNKPDYHELHSHFDWTVPDVQRGEATPITAYWPNAVSRLKRYNPQARLLFIVRHPVFRAHSHWKMEYKRGREDQDFEFVMSEAGRTRMKGQAHRVYSYVERGFYGQALQRIFEHFPDEQVLVIKSDDFRCEPEKTLKSVLGFLDLEIPSEKQLTLKSDYIVKVDTRTLGDLDYDQRNRHEALYIDDAQEFERLSGLSVREWFEPEYMETSGSFNSHDDVGNVPAMEFSVKCRNK